MYKEIYVGVRNGHKWTRYVALSVVLALAPVAGTWAASAPSHSTPGAVGAVTSSSTGGTVNPNGSKWI